MCTKFLGDGLCCGYDCYEETPMELVEVDLDAWVKYVDEGLLPLGRSFLGPLADQEDADVGEECPCV